MRINTEKELNLSWELLNEELDYEPATGFFTWKVSRPGVKKGKRAGSVKVDGYRKIRFKGQEYLEHRLAWFYYYKSWPNSILDHLDRSKTNNSIHNLVEASVRSNSQNRPDNSKYGHNIYASKDHFYVCVQLHNQTHTYFNKYTLEEAKVARDKILNYIETNGVAPEWHKIK